MKDVILSCHQGGSQEAEQGERTEGLLRVHRGIRQYWSLEGMDAHTEDLLNISVSQNGEGAAGHQHSAGIAFGQQLAYASSFIDGLKAKMLNVECGSFAHSVD